MNKKDPRPENAPWLMPYLVVKSAEETLAFYEKAFGFKPGTSLKDANGRVVHAEMHHQEAIIMFAPEDAWQKKSEQAPVAPATSNTPSPIGLYLYVADVDAFTAAAEAAGAEVTAQPETMFWGDRMSTLKDINGYQWSFATNVGDFNPELLPPGMG